VASVVDLPVTADIERGYGDVVATVQEAVAAGAVGVNLEDSQRAGGPLRTLQEQADDISAVRRADPYVVINARTDAFLYGLGDVPEVIERGRAHAEAGVRRVSLATTVAVAAYEAAYAVATQALTEGTIPLVGKTVGGRELNEWLSERK
jgi:2-methylisocitrate lyase-like PEP mutase family enzyme